MFNLSLSYVHCNAFFVLLFDQLTKKNPVFGVAMNKKQNNNSTKLSKVIGEIS